jgi:FkbM family methyltransferase
MRRLTRALKGIVSQTFRRLGYQIERDDALGGVPQLDVLELAALDLMATVPDPFLLQVGAYDGVEYDQVHHLIRRYRWRGLLVEPQPGAFARLVENYADQPQLRFEGAALADRDGSTTLYMPATVEGSPAVSVLASFDEQTLRRGIGHNARIRSVEVPTLTVPSLLARHGVAQVDILQVDTEGFDYEVIRMVLAARVEPSLIRYEHLHLPVSTRRACAELLAERGYRLHRDGIDTIAYRATRR